MLDADPEGAVVFRHACKMGLEGIVSKRLGSRCRSGRSPDWLKFRESGCAGGEACSIKGKFAVRAKLTGHRGIYHLESCGSQGGRSRVASGRTASQADASAGLIFSFDV